MVELMGANNVSINGSNVGLTVSVHFETDKAVQNLRKALSGVGKFSINIDTEKIVKATEELQKLNAIKLNIEGQQESLKYFTNVTKQLEKQVEASERIRKNMQVAGGKSLTKQYNADQKDLYTSTQKTMADIVKYEKDLLSLTGKEKQAMQELIATRRQELDELGKLITHKQYSLLYAEKIKQMEADITSEKLKQEEASKKAKEADEKAKEAEAQKKNNDRLAEAKKAYERIVELKLKIYELGRNNPNIAAYQEELDALNNIIRGYKSAKDTKEQLKKLEKAADTAYKQGVAEIDENRKKQENIELTKKQSEEEKKLSAEKKAKLKEANDLMKRAHDLKVELHKLDKDSPAAKTLKEELTAINKNIGAMKKLKLVGEEVRNMHESWNQKTASQMALNNNATLQKQNEKAESELKKTQSEQKAETKRYIDSLGSQIKDLYKAFYSAEEPAIQEKLGKKITTLQKELDIYREQAEWMKTIAKLDREIDTSKTVSMSKALQAEVNKENNKNNAVNKAWSNEFYSQYNKNLTESNRLEKAIREELVKTQGIKADVVKLDEQSVEALKQQGGYVAALASNLQQVRSNIEKFKDFTRDGSYNNVVKDHSIMEKQSQNERDQFSHSEKLLENQLKEAQLAEEAIPLQQRLLEIQLKRLSNNKYLTNEQRTELSNIQSMINALDGKTKAEVMANAQTIKSELSYQNQLATLNKENLTLEETARLEAELATYQKNKILRSIEDLETGKLAAHVDKERLETIRQMVNSLEGADKATIQNLTRMMNDGLSGIKHDAKVSSRLETEYANEQKLQSYISAQKDILLKQLESLNNEKLKGHVIEENRQKILAEINALDGANKEEVKAKAYIAQKNIELEKTNALLSQKAAQEQAINTQSTQAYYAEQEAANLKAKNTSRTMQDKIKELTAGKQLTAEQQKQIDNLQEIQRLMASNQILSMDQYNALNNQFNSDLKHYNSEAKQEKQVQAAQEEVRLAERAVQLGKQKLENRLKELEVGKNARYLDREQLATAKEMVAALSGGTRKEVAENIQNINSYINNMVSNANVTRIRATGTAFDQLRNSLGMLTRYFSGYMIINRFFREFREGLNVIKEVDSTLTTLRITLTNFTETDLANLMKASKEMAVELKTNFIDVMEVIKTVANETESMTTILAKSKPALILSNLTGLATSETVEMVQGVTRQYQSQFEALGLTAEEQGMKVADAMVAVSRSLGMDFSSGIAGMAEGIEIMGALSNELKLTLEETLALMASTAEQTRLTFSEISNAFKTTMARTIRISGTEDEISEEDLAKTEKALRGVGIEVRNFITGELRPFIDIMDDLADLWDGLSDSQRGAIGDAMGGARQISTVMAAINVTDRRKELTAIAEASQGAAVEAQEVWAQSLEAKLQELTNAGAMFWQSFINSESYHKFIESLTVVVNKATEIIEKFGSIPTVTAAITTAFLTMNKGMRSTMSGLTADILLYSKVKSGQNIVDQNGNAITLASIKADTAKRLGLQALTAEAVAAKVATIALQTALTLGLSVGITAVVTGISKLISGMETATEQIKNLNETVSNFNTEEKNTKTENDQIKQYEELSNTLKTLKKDSVEYLETQEEINDLVDSLSNIDSRYLVVLQDENAELEEQLNLLRFINEERLKESAQEADKKLLQNTWYNPFALSSKEGEAHDAYNALLQANLVLKQMQDQQEQAGINAYNQAIANNQSVADAQRAQFEAEQAYVDRIELAQSDAKAKSEELKNLILYFDSHNAMIDKIEAAGVVSSSRKLNLPKSIEAVRDALFKETEEVEDNTKALKFNAEAVDTLEQRRARLASEVKTTHESFIEYSKTLEELQNLYDDFGENGVTLSNIDSDLLADYTGNLMNASEIQEYLKQKIEETRMAQEEAYATMMENDEVFFEEKVKNSEAYSQYVSNVESSLTSFIGQLKDEEGQALAKLYSEKLRLAKEDLQNAKTIAESRAILEENLIQSLQGGWKEYYQKQVREWEGQFGDGRNPDGTYDETAYKAWQEIQEMNKLYQELANSMADKIQIKVPTFSSPKPPSSSSSSSSSSAVDDLDLEIDRYHDLNRAITRVNNALKANEIAQENATPTQKVKLMKEEIQLYQELQEAQRALYTEQKKETAELKKKLANNGFTFNADGSLKNYGSQLAKLEKSANKLSSDAKKAKIEEVKAIKELADAYEKLVNETLPNTQAEYKELTNTIKTLHREQLEYVADIQSQITSALEEELQKRNDAVKKALEKERDLYNKEYEEDQWEDEFNEEQRKLAEIQAQIDALSRDFSEAGRLKLEQLMEEYKEQQKVIDQMLQDKTHEDGNTRFDEAIDELDQELEDLLTPESLAGMVAEALEKGFISLNGEVIKTENLLTNMLKNSGELFLATGKLIQTELIDGLKVAQGLMKDVAGLSHTLTGNTSRSVGGVSAYSLTPEINTRAIEVQNIPTTSPSVTVSFGQLLNVEGNLDTTLMLDLDAKLQQAMNEVTHSISQALTYR